MDRLSALFEEDIEMQDALEDIDDLVDDSDDILLRNIEERYQKKFDNEIHLFENASTEENEDGLTPDEEAEYLASFLDDEVDDYIDDDIADDLDMED